MQKAYPCYYSYVILLSITVLTTELRITKVRFRSHLRTSVFSLTPDMFREIKTTASFDILNKAEIM